MRRCAVPTRSVKLKLVVPRESDGPPEARALWATHRAVNEAVAHYEGHLLLMRRRRMGIEPTTRGERAAGFEDQEGHQTPIASVVCGKRPPGLPGCREARPLSLFSQCL